MFPVCKLIRVRFPENSEKGNFMKEENSLTLKFPVKSFRKIPNPVANSSNSGESIPEMYQLIVDVKELPDNIPMDTNPRKQNLDTKVCKKIKDSLLSPTDRNFYILNRGILLSAASINFDNVNSMVTIDFEDTLVHGNVDGGHTYKVILENRDQLEINRQFVKVEVLTGIENMFESVAASRNTSFQVKEKSIANLRDMFDLIKESVKNESYRNDISYKENDDQRIDVQDILACLFMFNMDRFPQGCNTYPINAYSSKKACLDQYLSDYTKYQTNKAANPYVKMAKLIPDILRLYDTIEINMPVYYKGDSNDIKRYGRTVGVVMAKPGKKFQSKYLANDMDYATPYGFLYPILGAFRALIKEENGQYVWAKDPFETLDKLGPQLVSFTIEMSRQLGNNPNATGKSAILWNNLYTNVLMSLYR